jgi:hypothetical protein
VAWFNLALRRFSTGRVFGPHERCEFGSSKLKVPSVVGSDVVGDFVWYDDDLRESEETATARIPPAQLLSGLRSPIAVVTDVPVGSKAVPSIDGLLFEVARLALFGVRVRTIGASLAPFGTMMTV